MEMTLSLAQKIDEVLQHETMVLTWEWLDDDNTTVTHKLYYKPFNYYVGVETAPLSYGSTYTSYIYTLFTLDAVERITHTHVAYSGQNLLNFILICNVKT